MGQWACFRTGFAAVLDSPQHLVLVGVRVSWSEFRWLLSISGHRDKE